MKSQKTLTADERIQRVIISLLRTDPLYADYLLRWPRKIVPRGTIGVDGRSMIYNPEWINQQADNHLRFILKHEVMHVILKHTLREKGYEAAEMMKSDRLTPAELRAMLNTAGDLEINSLLTSGSDARDMPEHGMLPGRPGYEDHPARECMEGHFDILRAKHQPPQPPPEPPTGPDGQDEGEGEPESDPEGDEQQDIPRDADSGPQNAPRTPGEGEGDETPPPGDGQPTDDPSGKGQSPGDGDAEVLTGDGFGGCGEFMPDPEAATPAEAEAAGRDYDQQFIGAVLAAQGQGKCPGWAKERADQITAPAKVPWQVLLRRWARKTVRGGESSYSRPSRRTAHRTDIVLPSKRTQSIRRALFIVDTSGSMGTAEVNAAVPEMLKIMQTWKRAELVSIQCDTQVSDVQVYKPGTGFRELQAFARSPSWGGRGGTDMSPAFALAKKYRPEVIICLTDGYFSWPDQSEAHGIPTLWLMTNSHMVPPWGQRIVMEAGT